MRQVIEESQDNDLILSEMLADQIEQVRYAKSNKKVCDDLGIDYYG
jgi:hypothetical protein